MIRLLFALALAGAAFADCNPADCEGEPAAVFRRSQNHNNAVEALRTAFNTADSNDNNKFAGVEQRIDALNGFREEADHFVDDIGDGGATQGQAGDIDRTLQKAVDKFEDSVEYFDGKKAKLDGLVLEGVAEVNTSKINAMKEALNAFIVKWKTGPEEVRAGKRLVAKDKSKDDCRHGVDKLEEMVNALKDLRDRLNDTIDPVQEARDRAIDSRTDFQCECGQKVTEFILSQQQEQIDALQRDNQALRDFLTAQGFQGVPESTVPQSALDDVDGAQPGGSAPPSGPPAASTPPPSPPPGDDAPRGTALTPEQARGGLGAIAFANCQAMGYDCSAAAIYGPGGMVSVLAQHITNREVNDPNVLFAGDLIDFDAVRAAANN